MLRPFIPAPGYAIYPIRGLVGVFHLLHDEERREAFLIDTGLVGEVGRLGLKMEMACLGWRDIRAILLTHGHLDHTGNLALIKEQTGAPLYAHRAEQAHIDGKAAYVGSARLCGLLEWIGRLLLRYRTTTIDVPLSHGMELPFWGGLEVHHLPGHTAGHCGFYSRRFDLLFCGDMFASYRWAVHLPPPFLTTCAASLNQSLQVVRELNPRYLVPSHYDRGDYELQRRRFEKLARERLGHAPT
jgi:glyoxylase-like metal-dependent hydrolase (beta-lactamase superfamily II)